MSSQREVLARWQLILSSTPPISTDDPSGSRELETLHLDTPNVPHVHHVSLCDKRRVTINILPDDVLLLIFHFDGLGDIDSDWFLSGSWQCWHRIVHVCQRWRSLVFASPNFLHLRLICCPWTRVELTSIWPPLPIIIRNAIDWPMRKDYDFDAAIVHPNRVCEIGLYLTSSQLQILAIAMQEQFPALIHLKLGFINHDVNPDPAPAPALPDGFLGGTAPCLQTLELDSIPFPALPKLFLTAIDLVQLNLWRIPHSGYLAPETIVTGLAVMANLESLSIGFEPSTVLPDLENRRPPPSTRIILPSLTRLAFQGVVEYLEDLVAQIDAPMLITALLTFYRLIFDIPQVAQFMRRTTRFQVPDEAHLDLGYHGVQVGSIPPTCQWGIPVDEISGFRISVIPRELVRWHSSLAQFFTSILPFIYMVKHVYMYGPPQLSRQWRVNIDNIQWLEILDPLTALESLYLSKVFAQRIAPALQKLVGGRAIEVLPTLQNLYLERLMPWGPIQEGIEKFVAARQLSGHPMTVSLWERDPDPFEYSDW